MRKSRRSNVRVDRRDDAVTMTDPNLDPSRMPPSLWAASAPPAPTTRALPEGEHRCELLVVGGGFSGLSAALAGAGRGADTMLLEAAEIAFPSGLVFEFAHGTAATSR